MANTWPVIEVVTQAGTWQCMHRGKLVQVIGPNGFRYTARVKQIMGRAYRPSRPYPSVPQMRDFIQKHYDR